ncbi:MAG: WD40 repeat domain-containing protein [Candidatus Asgardarchaeum sp.]
MSEKVRKMIYIAEKLVKNKDLVGALHFYNRAYRLSPYDKEIESKILRLMNMISEKIKNKHEGNAIEIDVKKLLRYASDLEKDGDIDGASYYYSRVLYVDPENKIALRKIQELKQIYFIRKQMTLENKQKKNLIGIKKVQCSPDGKYIAYAGYHLYRDNFKNKIIQVINLKTKKNVIKIDTEVAFTDFTWSPDSKYIAIATENGVLTIFDLKKKKFSKKFDISKLIKYVSPINDLCWSADYSKIAMWIEGGFILIKNPLKSNCTFYIKRYRNNVVSGVSLHPNGNYLAVCVTAGLSSDEIPYDLLHIWDLKRKRVIAVFETHINNKIDHFLWSSDGKHLIYNEDNYIVVVNFEKFEKDYLSGKFNHFFELNKKRYFQGIPGDNYIAGVIDIRPLDIIEKFEEEIIKIKSIASSPDGKYVAVICSDNRLELINLNDLKITNSFDLSWKYYYNDSDDAPSQVEWCPSDSKKLILSWLSDITIIYFNKDFTT